MQCMSNKWLNFVCLQVADTSNALFQKNDETDGQGLISFTFSNAEKGENEPLLLQYGSQYSS